MWGLAFTDQEPPFDLIDLFAVPPGMKIKVDFLYKTLKSKVKRGRSTPIYSIQPCRDTLLQVKVI